MVTLAQRFYNTSLWAAQPFLVRKLRRRGRLEPLYLEHIPERFGVYSLPRPEANRASGKPLIWIHAVSLGETKAAGVLLTALRERWPQMRLLLTHGTATGRSAGLDLLEPGDVQVWQPWDTRRATARFFQTYRPDAGLLMETEVWPNLIGQAHKAGVPMFLANARLSERSLRGARRAAAWLQPAYAQLSGAWAQTAQDAARLSQAGVGSVEVLGNLKFDAKSDPVAAALGETWRRGVEKPGSKPVVMFASSRDTEEVMLLKAISQDARSHTVQWLIVPRHPQRFEEVALLCQGAGWKVSRRSTWPSGALPEQEEGVIWLGDSLGEMTAYYTLAEATLLGGSFAPLGGQNLIEAAACGCPVIMGAHTFNFAQVSQLAQVCGAALRCKDMLAALPEAIALCADVERRAVMEKSARRFAASQQGAAKRMAQALARFL